MSLTKVTYSMIDGPVVNLSDFAPVADGTTNDGQKILDAIAATPVNGTLVIPAGDYGVSALEITRSDITIVLEGTLVNITTLSPPPQLHTGAPGYGAPPNEVSNYPTLYLNGCQNLTITGIGGISTPWYEGIKAVDCDFLTLKNFKIEGVRVTDTGSILRGAWDGIWMSNCTNILIDNLEIFNIGGIRQYLLDQRWSGNPNGVSGNGITTNGCSILTIQNCYIHDLAWQTIYPMDTQKARILNNVCENATGFCQYNALGDWSVTPLDYVIDSNVVRNMSGNGLDLSVGSTGVTLAAGRITNNTFRYIGNLPDMTGQFDGAYISVNAPSSGYITDIVFQGNIMEEGCTDYGIYFAEAQNIIFSNNVVRKTGKMAIQLGEVANINISDNSFQEIDGNLITLSSGSANPYLIVSGNICNIAGFPIAEVGGATAAELMMINNRFVVPSAVSVGIDLSDATFDGNYFGPNMTVTFTGDNLRIDRNVFEEVVTMRLNEGIVSSNNCYKGLSLPDTVNTTINNNVVNASEGDFTLAIFIGSLARQPNKLSVLGNIVYANNSGTAISSTATNSVFANVSPDGTNSITGTGTTVLY